MKVKLDKTLSSSFPLGLAYTDNLIWTATRTLQLIQYIFLFNDEAPDKEAIAVCVVP